MKAARFINLIMVCSSLGLAQFGSLHAASMDTVFLNFSENLKIFHQFMVQDENGFVRLKIPATVAASFDTETLQLIDELVDYTNESILQLRFGLRDGGNSQRRASNAQLQKYFAYVEEGNVSSPNSPAIERSAQAPEDVCGSFANPLPDYKLPFATLTPEQYGRNYESYLEDLGFHKTSENLYGGGWTRPKTYKPEICKTNSFRDHAYFWEQYKYIQIQIYKYTPPYGEPNPEIDDYSWPYMTWPAYVAWWHAKY